MMRKKSEIEEDERERTLVCGWLGNRLCSGIYLRV